MVFKADNKRFPHGDFGRAFNFPRKSSISLTLLVLSGEVRIWILDRWGERAKYF